MRYFVTGGAGFIGSNFVEHLLKDVQGVTLVTIYDKFTYAANPKNYEDFLKDPRLRIVKGDVCDYSLLIKTIASHDFVIHFAAESHVDRSINDASHFVKTNTLGTFNVLEASRNSGIRTVINVSTDEVYGSVAKGSADENHCLAPNSPYSATKASSDMLARSYHATHGLDVRTTRCTNNYGKFQFPEKIIPLFIRKLLAGEDLPLYGDGKNSREWIHVTDHVTALQTVLERGEPGEIYNIGSGTELSNNELARGLLEITGTKLDSITYVPDRKGHDFRYSVNSQKIGRLGFQPKITFREGLIDTINWYKNNPDWWKFD